MDGCIVCGVQHIGSCNPQHPTHHPLSAEQWADREKAHLALQAEWAEREAEGEVMGADLESAGTERPRPPGQPLVNAARPAAQSNAPLAKNGVQKRADERGAAPESSAVPNSEKEETMNQRDVMAMTWREAAGLPERRVKGKTAQQRDVNETLYYAGEAEAVYLDGDESRLPPRALDFHGKDLRGVNFVEAEAEAGGGGMFLDADFRGADLRGARMQGRDLEGADFRGADLRGASFRGANLKDANLEGAVFDQNTFRGARMNGELTMWETVKERVGARVERWLDERVEAAAARAESAEGKVSAVSRAAQTWDQTVSQPLARARNWLSEQQAAGIARVENWRAERATAAIERAYPAAERGHRDNTLPAEPGRGVKQLEAREQSAPSRRYDLETPGPTEAAGGSFQVVSTPAEAERAAARIAPGQEYRIDRARDTDGPTGSHVVTTLPPPAAVARNPAVEERIAALEDPEERAKAWKLLETIRSEVAAQERPISRERSKEIELER